MPEPAAYWLKEFIADFELNYNEACRGLSSTKRLEIEVAAIRAMIQTLQQSGMTAESVVEAVGRIVMEATPGAVKWNAELNQRRFALIDKEIQGTISPAEKIELAGLTNIMREQVDLEANLPMEGAKALHRKLLKMELPPKSK